MKIGFNLVFRKDALWVRVLHSKYGWKDQLPDTIHTSNCSYLWRSLFKVWPFFCENLIWSVGDGSAICGWKDFWVPDVGPLFSYMSTHSSLDLESTLKDWLTVKQRLLTNSERARRGFGQSSACLLCGHDIEDILYVLWDCSTTKEAWMLVVPIEKQSSKVYKKVQIQIDNLEVVRALSMKETIDSGITLLKRVKRLLCFEGQWEIKYVPRECNLIADQLAKISLSLQTPLQLFEVFPDLVVTTIQQDKAFRVS
ncbi:hypothetical protein CXB51_020227 [Gossypium anomalum]|uniref:Reverse transcriptase zinc-binding domain-containing protein n=1 Tax=Gossypium anomalum TaxID=47600 RepID=A0A8J5YNJ8_9ROSI|nr:hypothetical protein CXB51_020227 [Gossypium anomalum]